MGIQIRSGNSITIVVQPFVRKPARTVQLWYDVQKHQHNLVYTKSASTRKNNRKFVIEFSLQTFRSLVALGDSTLQHFARKIIKPGSHSLSRKPIPMDATMQQCIYRMTNYAEEESAKCLYIYGQIVELLVLTQLSFAKSSNEKPVYVKNEYDKERILYARDYLLTHLDAPPRLEQLAGIVGINVFKLKCGFKEMFGQPPFTYLAEVRLEMARTALKRKEKTITQIAFELGYASLQHFSAAFKKKFGMPPAQVI